MTLSFPLPRQTPSKFQVDLIEAPTISERKVPETTKQIAENKASIPYEALKTAINTKLNNSAEAITVCLKEDLGDLM